MILAKKTFFISFIFGFILFPYFIKLLKKISKDGQPIRSYGPESHLITKKNIPPMGGIIILTSALLPILFWTQLTQEILFLVFITLFFALLGFIDDYLKLKTNHHRGLSAKTKILIQFVVTLVCMFILKLQSAEGFTKISLFREVAIDLGYLYLPFAAFVIVGSANAVNLTDGLDGLAATQAITSFAFLGLVAYITRTDVNITFFCIAFIGAILSFLWFNTHPAKIFMGDVGSLSIGAALGLTSVLIKKEMLFAVIGIIFVIETLSVIIQVSYFKYTKFRYGVGRRIFLMTPIHHHFEKKGWSENTIVIKFWIISIVCSIFALTFLL
ncbi:MAG: phospho-N-acetylmuramoyl-pentapeptide-transferase [Wolbachia endosymbiont of Homalodisca vitripennis]|uniref:phospho-N-acetylmuramoyl-pentapeptide- transferase n=1 Tax=Wolbachia endosymbiont of Rhagoletis cingulata TaxID=1220542 RepID=UPI001BBBDB88|nr:phospho-N-acetylmuramoyl-pentapeptide-transferase [Wolbachia endosymbiont of Homalodisca vitripennis]MCJ7454653.1 phospho-N-acetylmuramoyl-pentapeptide-transferase [Wolbachia endosymbiont of Homalodisca vitripennis]MCJ7475974.1 phospho-N-acetylmuramoyl-pentapeptide-transferase [Wolbachia endosymbiont of Homalodisca vitripennis]